MTQDEAFKAWWYTEGSQAPYTHHDCEEHTMRMCEIAWANGAFVEREACAKLCETLWDTPTNGMATEEKAYGDECAAAIRAREQA
jgi:hypothetical protein